MISALHSAATGMEAQMAQIESISNNIANINTNGFKKSKAEFQDLLYETLQEPGANTSATTASPVGIQTGMGVRIAGTHRNFEQGTVNHTNQDLDLMIRGDGFFMVQLPNGDIGYKRDGSFHRSSAGRIETIDGYPIVPELNIPQETKRIEIAEDGAVYAYKNDVEKTQLGQIQIATFVNKGGLKAQGKNIFLATEASGQANVGNPSQSYNGSIMQYYVEGSNVDIMNEMTQMITSQRAFEMNSKVIQTVDQMLQHTSALKP